ncbi:insulinase family protein [Synechococcus sp. M16CYN]
MITGLDLILEPLTSPGVMAAKLWLPFGSALDPTGQRGAHELLASLLSRGCGPYNHCELADLVEGCGAGLRCDAQEDGLLLSLHSTVEEAERLLPLLAWMVHDPHLQPDQVALERNLTLQTLQRQREDPFHTATVAWRELVFGSGGYAHDPLGVECDLKAIKREHLLPLAQRLPVQGNVLALAGSMPEQMQERILEMQGFRDWPHSPEKRERLIPLYGTQLSRDTIRVESMDTEQVVLMLGQATVPSGHPDDLVMRLLQCHLGTGMSSLLFRRLREEYGVAYEVAVHYPQLAGPAPFVMLASTGVERAKLTLCLLLQTWEELSQNTLTQADLQLACAKFIGQVAYSRQTCSQRAERRVQLRAMGLNDDYDQRCVQAVRTITPEKVKTTCQHRLKQPRLSLCGPTSSLRELERVWLEQNQPVSF